MLIIASIILIIAVAILGVQLLKKNVVKVEVDDLRAELNSLEKGLLRIEGLLSDEMLKNRNEINGNLQANRVELNNAFKELGSSVLSRIGELVKDQKTQFDTFVGQEQKQMESFEAKLDRMNDAISKRLNEFQQQNNTDLKNNRDELSKSLKSFEEKFIVSISDFSKLQKQELELLTYSQRELLKSTDIKLESMRQTMEDRLQAIQNDNSEKLEKMRTTVDEKLHQTLEKRLGESFKLVSERLESVQRGLGEMKELVDGVGNLKKVLSNVKSRGVMGEYQLANILDQLLSVDQYGKNVQLREGSASSVEYAVKLPGQSEGEVIWLPIDSKFPLETYEQLLSAFETGDLTVIDQTKKNLETAIKIAAKDINTKYVIVPNTTDFAIMFLPFEGLYAEVLRIPGLFDQIQREYKVIITGPTTLSAILNSLQMGFRTLVIQRRSSEIWKVLGAIKTEFNKFGDVLKKAQDKIHKAGQDIDELVGTRTRQIQRKLRDIQELPANEAGQLIEPGSEESRSQAVQETVPADEDEIPF